MRGGQKGWSRGGWDSAIYLKPHNATAFSNAIQSKESPIIKSPTNSLNHSVSSLRKSKRILSIHRKRSPGRAVSHIFSPMTTTTLMSTSITLTMSQAVSACPTCGVGLPEHSQIAADAQRQIEDLQVQVRLLTQKATAAGMSLLPFPPDYYGRRKLTRESG